MLRNVNLNTLKGALCIGGFVGWYLTVMYICEKSLEIYGTPSLFEGTNIIFCGSLLVVLVIMMILMTHLDFEGLLNHRYFRIVPAVLMAESGLALAFTNADSFSVYAVITGICAAFGVLAVFSSLLNVKVGQRLFSVAVGAAIGGAVRLTDQIIYTYTDMTRGIYVLAIISGILALVTVRSSGFSKEEMPIISYSETSTKNLVHNLPSAYILLLFLAAAYYFCRGKIAVLGAELYAPSFRLYEIFTYIPFIIAALIIGLFIKFHNVAPIFIFGMCFMSYSAILLYLPYFSPAEEAVFLAFYFAGQACFDVFSYIFIITFAMDRPHPLFYATLGYATVIAAQLAANLFNYSAPSENKTAIIAVMAILIVTGGPVIFSLLKKYGFTQESFEYRKALRGAIKAKSDEMALSDRERYLLELVVLDGYTAEQLPDKMMLSRNTIRAQSRNLLQKLEIDEISELRQFFENILSSTEQSDN